MQGGFGWEWDPAGRSNVIAANARGRLDMDADKKLKEPLGRQEGCPVEDWKAREDRLQEIVCLLLAKNETLRLALSAERAGKQYGNFL